MSDKRNYKDATAEDTIFNIRKILKNVGLFTLEINWANPYNNLFSVGLTLDEENGFGYTWGKGQTPQYALASAYGEFMERVQNASLEQISSKMFSGKLLEEHGFMYHPDEKLISIDDFQKIVDEMLIDNFNNDNEGAKQFNDLTSIYLTSMRKSIQNVFAVPFYDVKNNKLAYIPFRFVYNHCLSNGMCAGNTPEEALCQGLYEIVERDATKQIYNRMLTPPTIPDEFLKQFPMEYSIIEQIQKNNTFKVIVKDFSAGENYPVIAVLIIDLKRKLYKLSKGSDAVFQVALGRALTEFYQGLDTETFTGTPVPEEEYSFFINNDIDSVTLRSQNFFRQFRPGPAVYPYSIFKENPSYEFNSDIYKSADSFQEEAKRLIDIFLNKGKNVYIRDTSFLGFPSYYIFIPGISWHFYDVESMFMYYSKEELPDLMTIFKTGNIELTHSIIEKLEETNWTYNILKDAFHLNFRRRSELCWLYDIPFLLAILYYRVKEYKKSLEKMDKFLSVDRKRTPFNNAVYQYILNKSKGKTVEDCEAELKSLEFPADVISEVNELLRDEDKLLMNYKTPKCPECNICPLSDECITKNSLRAVNKVYKAMKEYKIDQMDFINIFK